ncbi:MAG: hypothetical protein GY839_18875 [candidate division Zixibacteria bacterium]|nr:hypothetical protein [candidate division Zixibacteria bacterium]
MPQSNVYGALANLLIYPDDNLQDSINECANILKASGSTAVEPIKGFARYVRESSIEDMQEYYTQTFEFNKERALEVGWHLFGERYERGMFIVRMRQTLRQLNLAESTELPDHLAHVLAALGMMGDREAKDFATLIVMPAIQKMLAGFKEKENQYAAVLDGIRDELITRYNLPEQGKNHG